jgi:hypothetical protein
MLTTITDWIIRLAQRTPYQHIPDYMERYWILPYTRFGLAIRVHHILRSDSDRVFHDHPWPFITVILRGGYTEVTPIFVDGIYAGERRRDRGPGSILLRRASAWHRLEVATGKTAWTLFITGPKVQRWGFLTIPEYKTYWRDYLDDYETQGTPGG